MDLNQLKALKANLKKIQSQSADIKPNGFAASRSMDITGIVIGAEQRSGYQQISFADSKGNAYTLLNKTPENNAIEASDDELSFTIANGVKHNDAIWIVKAL